LIYSLAISVDGSKLAFGTSGALYTADPSTTTNLLIESGATSYRGLRFSRDGLSLVCTRLAAQAVASQVLLYDLQAGGSILVSSNPNSGAAANGASDSPDISADGRFIAYRSAAADLVPGVTNGVPAIFLYDRHTRANSLLSSSRSGNLFPDNRSLLPVFSADGHTLCFESWASDITAQDFNHSSDLFSLTFFYAVLLPSTSPSQGPWLSWPYVPGTSYRVQFKDDLNQADWQQLSGAITNAATKAWLQDPAPTGPHRFYRIVTF